MKLTFKIALVIFLYPVVANAKCEDFFQKWADDFGLVRQIVIEKSTCSDSPFNPDLTLAALAFSKIDNSAEEGEYDLGVLLANSSSGEVVARTIELSAISYDAIQFDGLSIDKAEYRLGKVAVAFGLRIGYTSSSSMSVFNATTLNLYAIEGKNLRNILNDLVVESSLGERDGLCEGVISKTFGP